MKKYIKEYIDFISDCKTERECVNKVVAMAEKNGFVNLKDIIKEGKKLCAGDKIYVTNMNKNILLAVIGKQDLENGINLIGSHIDSPRLDLKVNPVFENKGICYFDTHYYGGIKKYQWVTRPLALHGIVCKKDGSIINLNIGENENDPVFVISDLLPHLDKVAPAEVTFNGEILDIVAGSLELEDAKKDKIKQNVLKILKEYNIEEEDLASAEIEVVPTGRARELGFDKSLILGYGQDDKEEIGSDGPTGMSSKFMENQIAEIYNAVGEYSELKLRRCLSNSTMLSADVSAGYDPSYPKQTNYETEAKMNKGIAIIKYTGSRGKSGANDANPEFISKIRKILDDNNVTYQTSEMGKVDQGGGGTIAHFVAEYDMEVLDAGTPVMSMHAPCEITSKIDVYETYKCYKAYLKDFH